MSTPRDPKDAETPKQHSDHPGKPFRTPNKTKTHPAPERATDGEPKPREKH